MPRPVSEQVAVIVGASSGIGRASALAFARRGARVVCAARGVAALDALVDEIVGTGGVALAVATDVADPAAVRALAHRAEGRFGRIDTWVNAAAISIWGRVEDISDAEFDRVMRVNFLGQVHGVHAALPALRRAGGGVVIGISSVEGVRAFPLQAPYAASKWALRGFYDSLRVELAQQGEPIAVTTILPASIDTPFFTHARARPGARPKPPPPVYAATLVADAVVRAAEHPSREVPVGGTAIGAILAQRVSPALTDALLSVRRFGIGTQTADRPIPGPAGRTSDATDTADATNTADNVDTDNVDAPTAGPGRVSGGYPGRVLRRSALTTLLGHWRRPVEHLTAAVAGLHHAPATSSTTAAADTVPGPGPVDVERGSVISEPDRTADRTSGEQSGERPLGA